MMRALPLRVYKLFAVVLLTLCIGAQVLEATGRWDRSLQDAGDEAVIVAIVIWQPACFSRASVPAH